MGMDHRAVLVCSARMLATAPPRPSATTHWLLLPADERARLAAATSAPCVQGRAVLCPLPCPVLSSALRESAAARTITDALQPRAVILTSPLRVAQPDALASSVHTIRDGAPVHIDTGLRYTRALLSEEAARVLRVSRVDDHTAVATSTFRVQLPSQSYIYDCKPLISLAPPTVHTTRSDAVTLWGAPDPVRVMADLEEAGLDARCVLAAAGAEVQLLGQYNGAKVVIGPETSEVVVDLTRVGPGRARFVQDAMRKAVLDNAWCTSAIRRLSK
mmetsp:Transcript_24965/g.77775  ORF Transcript_24965/g.77775 Transcript_24965/m.77775 type:complete len:273 (+) Transcript_24965:787-1605(+)